MNDEGSRVTFSVTAAEVYYIQLGGYRGAQGTFDVTLTESLGAPINDNFANVVTFTETSMAGSNEGATMEVNEYNFDGDLGGSVWFEWSSIVDQRIRLDTCDSDFDTLLVVWEGLTTWPLNGTSSVSKNDDGCDSSGAGSEVTFDAEAGVNYFFQVGGYVDTDANVDMGSFSLKMLKGTTAPTSAVAVAGDSSVSLSWTAPPVVAGASPNVGYQVEYSDDPTNNFVPALGDCAPELTETSTMTQCEATGLLNGTTYYFSVRAIAPVVWSSWSSNSNAVTPRTAPAPTPNPTPGGGSIPSTPIVPLAPVVDPTPETQSAVAPTPEVAAQPTKATEMKVIKRIISFRSGSAQLTKLAKKKLKTIARDSRSAKKTETTVSARLIPTKATEANRILANQRTAAICRYLKASKLRGTCAKKTWILQPGSKDFGPRVNLRQVREISIR
jgi:outer membrane protein OmpA-like peptidoglycan-associated protein